MKEGDPKALRERLAHKQRQLDLVLAVDRIRDTFPEPAAMMPALVNVLAEQFQTDVCLLCVLDRATGHLELKAVNARQKQFAGLERSVTRELLDCAVQAGGVAVWSDDDIPPGIGWSQPPGGLHLAVVSIAMEAEQLGALVLARAGRPFDANDVDLLRIAEGQLDSAIMQVHTYRELEQRNKELETIYRIDHIRDRQIPFDEMLNAVLQELCAVVQAEMGFIMLYDRTGNRLELRVSTNEDLFRVSPYHEIVEGVAREALDRANLVCNNELGDVLRSVMCMPLTLNNEVLGIFGAVNRYRAGGFDDEDSRILKAVANLIDTAIFERLERRRLRRVLGRSVDPRVLEHLLTSSDIDCLKGERSVLSVLYVDIRGSTVMAEMTAPELLVEFMNDYRGRMTDVVLAHEGTLDKYIGDAVMALFGAPVAQPDHALRAVRVGLAMQTAHHSLIEDWRARGLDAKPIGVGIGTGELIVGEMGCPQRTDYSVIGSAANLGALICDVAEPGQVLVCETTYDQVRDRVEASPIADVEIKGIARPVTIHNIERLLG